CSNTADIKRDKELLKYLQENESLLSREWKDLGGCVKKSTFDRIVTRLQMGGYVVTADFEYRYDAKGDRQGIGIACYTTPEALFGNDIILHDVLPTQSLDIIIKRLKSHTFLKDIDTDTIYKLLTVKKI
ncbi:MAG: hypothetical protein ACI31C_07825, partial [Muribaculaceae bacterium]